MADHYTYRVTWSEEDQEYVGLCAEFPGLSWLSGSQPGALKGIIALVSDVVRDLKNESAPVPEPLADKKFSGKFVVRVPPEVHRSLAMEAAESGVSLNRLANAKLTK